MEKTYPNLNESTVAGFRKRYEAQIKDAHCKKKSPKNVIINKLRGHPCLLGYKINPLVENYLKATRYKGGIVNSLVAIATVTALLKWYPCLEKENLKIERSWAQSLFRCMGFVCRIKTTGKVHNPVGAQKEAELEFLHQIVNQVEKYQIPPSFLNHQFQSNPIQICATFIVDYGKTWRN